MSDVYKIAVALAMQSNAPALLATISQHLLGVHTKVKDLEGGFNRLHVAIGGALAVAAGASMLKGLKAITDQAAELNHQLASVASLSSDKLQSAALRTQALASARATTDSVNGTHLDRNVKLFAETYSMFGGDNAQKLNAPLARFGMVLGGITGNYEKADESLYEMVRSGDLTGKMINEKTHQLDTDKLLGYLDLAGRVSAATHNKVGPHQFFQLAQQGGPAIRNLSDDGLMGMVMAAQGMGGSRAGTSSMSLYSQLAGGKMTAQVAKELHEKGLVGDFHTIRGGGVEWEKGALETPWVKTLLKDPLTGAKQLRDKFEGGGMTEEESTKELFKVFGRQTVQRLMNDFMANFDQMAAERGRLKGAQGIEQQDETRESDDYERNIEDVKASWHNLMAEIGLPLTKVAIDYMKQFGSTLHDWSTVVRGIDPDTIANIGKGVAILGGFLIGAGGAALLAALGPAGWLVGGLVALGVAMKTYQPKQFSEIAKGYSDLWTAIKSADFKGVVGGLVDIVRGEFHLLPEKVQAVTKAFIAEIYSWPDRLGAAISAMGAALVASIGAQLQSIANSVKSFFHINFTGTAPGGGVGGSLGAGGAQKVRDMERGIKGGMPSPADKNVTVHAQLNVDGRVLARSVTKHQVAATEFPLGIHGGADDFGSFVGPGTTFQPA